MKQVIMMKGLPGCGKSTRARQMSEENPGAYKIVNKDALRAMLDGGRHSRDNEAFILGVRDHIVATALAAGRHVIVDDTNLAPKHEARLRQLAREHGASFTVYDMTDVDVETCIKQDRMRLASVGERVIRGMHRQYFDIPAPPPEHVPDAPTAIICDLDGTLAILNGRNPYDASTCGDDLVCEPVATVLRDRYEKGDRILYVSGREECHREATARWLTAHNLPGRPLLMRPTSDFRKDAVIKREIYDNHIRGRYNVRFVLDDRPQVVRMWRSLGLTVLQLNDVEF